MNDKYNKIIREYIKLLCQIHDFSIAFAVVEELGDTEFSQEMRECIEFEKNAYLDTILQYTEIDNEEC